jgi:serine/threonine-protein kinase
MITPAGVVKVLDFGLAAVIQPAAGGSGDSANSPTLTMGATQAGMIMGTAGYMSPEQAAGQPVDARADIWAFGVVLWEMLTGKRLFQGDTVAHILAAVLTKEPDWESAPAKVRPLLRYCLQKKPEQRLQAIGDWRVALEAGAQESAPSRSRLGLASGLGWVCAGIATLAALSLGFIHLREKPVDSPLVRLDVDLGGDVSLPPWREAAWPSLPTVCGWPTCLARPRSCLPGVWTNRKPPSCRERKGRARRSFRRTGTGLDSMPPAR